LLRLTIFMAIKTYNLFISESTVGTAVTHRFVQPSRQHFFPLGHSLSIEHELLFGGHTLRPGGEKTIYRSCEFANTIKKRKFGSGLTLT